MIPRILVIAGSDSGGGAGIQADLKTIAMLGGHGMTAITAITAQNTLGVTAVELVSPAMVIAQIDAVISDIGVDAIKIGMIGSVETAHIVASRLSALDGIPIVFDPVMVSTSGSILADPDTIAAFDRLMRLATLITPNLPELEALAGEPAALARETGAAVLLKGGHAEGTRIVDRLIEPNGTETLWEDDRIDTRHNHGTGCTLASAIATGLGAGMALPQAITLARGYVRQALLNAPALGAGHGPMGFSPYIPLPSQGGEVNYRTLGPP